MIDKRNDTIDVIKGLLILLVVLGHDININYGLFTLPSKIIYSFHMPAFFVVSGFLMHITFKGNEISWISKKLIQRIIPIIVFSILYYLLSYYSYLDGGYVGMPRYMIDYSIFGYVYHLISTGMGSALWFIWTLIMCGSIVAISCWISRKFKFDQKKEIILFVYMCIVICCIKLTRGDSFGLEEIQWFLPFFMSGYLISKNVKYFKKNYIKILILLSIPFIPLCIINDYHVAWVNASVWLWHLSFADSLYRFACAMSGTAFIVLLAIGLTRIKYLKDALRYCGEHSLRIYVIHPLFIIMPFMINGIDKVIVGYIASISVCIISGYVLMKIWFFRAFMFGEWKDINRVKWLNKIFVVVGRKLEVFS